MRLRYRGVMGSFRFFRGLLPGVDFLRGHDRGRDNGSGPLLMVLDLDGNLFFRLLTGLFGPPRFAAILFPGGAREAALDFLDDVVVQRA